MSTAWWYTAANDTEFAATRHRTLPITASITPIANYPSKLRNFRTNASRFWQGRCYFKGKTYTQSLRTTNKQSAISLAKQFFHIKTAKLYGETVDKQDDAVKFADVVQATLAQQLARAERGEITREGVQIFRNRLYKSILPFFGNLPFRQITYSQITDFVSLPSNHKLTADTIQQHLVAAVQVYEHILARQQNLEFGADDDYLFLRQLRERKLALELLGWQFRYSLKSAEIGANSANDKSRTP